MHFDYLVISGGKLPPFSFVKKLSSISSHLVAVDRGALMLNKLKATAELFVGDGDSLPSQITFRARKSMLLPRIKDLSDLEFALGLLPKNSTKLIIGAHNEFQNRSDHLFVNLMLALRHDHLYLADDHGWITGIKNRTLKFQTPTSSVFSVISPHALKLSIKGSRFDVKDLRVTNPSHGLSNETKPRKDCTVNLKGSGLLFVSCPILKSKIKL